MAKEEKRLCMEKALENVCIYGKNHVVVEENQ